MGYTVLMEANNRALPQQIDAELWSDAFALEFTTLADSTGDVQAEWNPRHFFPFVFVVDHEGKIGAMQAVRDAKIENLGPMITELLDALPADTSN